MGFFSRITKFVKRTVKKAAPFIATVAPFIPQLAPFASVIGAVSGARGPQPAPGTRRDVGPPIRGGPSTFPRQRTFGPPIRNPAALGPGRGGFGPRPMLGRPIQFGTISAAENRGIDAAIQLGQAAFNRGPIAGPSPLVLQRPAVGSPIFAGGINPMAIGSIISGIGRTIFGGGARAGGGALITGGAAGNLVLSSTGRILSVITASGARIGRKRAVSIAKFLGLNAAAAALGIGVVELAQMTVDETGRPRRRRGITARDFATTRRTMTKIKSMHAMLPTRGTSRRSPSHVRTAAITHG